MAEPTEPALITPAMLEEEEQLEAAGLERERKMLEEVKPRDPGFSPPSVPSPLSCSFRELRGSLVPYLFRTCVDGNLGLRFE